MITHASGVPTLYYYTNFQPVFDEMKKFTNSYSRLLQNSAAFWNPSIRTSVHINPRSVEKAIDTPTVGKHVNVVG